MWHLSVDSGQWENDSLWWVVVVALFTGCGGGDTEKLAPVVGKVTVNGGVLASGSVTFHPDVAKGNLTSHIPVGSIDSNGNYKLMSSTQEGAPLGWYKVTVAAQEPIDPKNPYAPPKHVIDPKFSDPGSSGLELEVVATPRSGAYDIKLAK